MADHFESPKFLIERAREHTNDLNAKIVAFANRKPSAIAVEFDPKTGQDVYKVRLTAKLPGSMAAVLKDATGNLRDALDHATYASAASFGNPKPRYTGFPFARDQAGVEGELDSKRLRDIPREMRPLLTSFEPHEAGNKMLCALNRIRNTKTHRLLVPLGTQAGFQGLKAPGTHFLHNPIQMGYSRWDPAKQEVEYMRLGRGSVFHHDVRVAFTVTFGNVEGLAGEPVIPMLNALASEVERIVLAIEAETARVLRSKI